MDDCKRKEPNAEPKTCQNFAVLNSASDSATYSFKNEFKKIKIRKSSKIENYINQFLKIDDDFLILISKKLNEHVKFYGTFILRQFHFIGTEWLVDAGRLFPVQLPGLKAASEIIAAWFGGSRAGHPLSRTNPLAVECRPSHKLASKQVT